MYWFGNGVNSCEGGDEREKQEGREGGREAEGERGETI